MIRPPSYWHRLGDATSQWLNVFFLNGNANESISGRAWRKAWLNTSVVIDRGLGQGHCEAAYITDLARAMSICRIATPSDLAKAQAVLEMQK